MTTKKRAGKAAARSRGRSARSKARGRKTATGSPGISRIDQASTRTHGFFVRVGYHRTREGSWRPRHRAFFGDATYGGKAKALKSAQTWLKKVSNGGDYPGPREKKKTGGGGYGGPRMR